MLTLEARKRRASYEYSNQMVNIGWVAGWLERTKDPQRIIVHQGSKAEFGIPIEIKQGESMRPGYKDGSPIKVTCRIAGQFLREKGERIAVFRALDIDNPTVLDMQPYERRTRKADALAEGAAEGSRIVVPASAAVAAEAGKVAVPKKHRVLLPDGIKAKLSSSANFVRVAGYVGGVAVEPGKMRDDGRPGEPCLVIMLQQDENPEHAIPIRCYNRLADAIADKLPIGIPIIINDGEIKIKAVFGTPGEDGVVPFIQYPYIKARVPKIASQDHILNQPAWAERLLKSHLAAKAKRVVARREAAAAGNGGNGNGESHAEPVAAVAAGEVATVAEVVTEGAAPAAKPKASKTSLAAVAPE